ncbi:MAG: serine hydrolase [Desulfobacterales bacterium]|nr:MAG: serine hydrolase [Desulfobacterales bacterium]
MFAIKIFINLFSAGSVSILISCVCIGFLLGCSAEGTINGPTINVPEAAIPEDDALEWVAPEAVGWSSAELEAAQEFAQQSGCRAVMALYDGKIFFSRGNIHKNYEVHSMRMPFLSALYGIHVSRGTIDLNATLEDLHIDDIAPGLTDAEKQAQIAHLLMSRSGVYHQAAAEDQTMIDERPARGSHGPDTFFYYDNWGFNALGTIFEQETGEEIFKAFKKEIADVLGMVDFSIDNCSYQYEWDKSLHPTYHFKMSVRDMAKFGALYQRNGLWKGLQIIASEWIDESTMAYSTMADTDGLGYGYMWKIIPEDSEMGQMIGYPGYYHTAADGYVLVVIPDLKLVIVERYDTDRNWEDPEDDAFELSMLILDARIAE